MKTPTQVLEDRIKLLTDEKDRQRLIFNSYDKKIDKEIQSLFDAIKQLDSPYMRLENDCLIVRSRM
jgi:hypothetical protein